MGRMFDLLDRLDKTELKPIIVLCFNDSKYDGLQLIKGQLKQGKNQNDENFYFYESQQYSLDKEKLNPLPGLGRADFFVTGQFYEGIQMVVNSSQYNFTIFGTDQKTPRLEELISNQGGEPDLIYGLDPENTQYFANEILKPKIITELKSQLGLT